MEQSFLERYGKTILISMGGVLGVAVIAWWFFFYDMRLTVVPTPSSAKVTVDGNDVSGQKQVKLKPGSHTLVVSAGDYVTLEQTIHAKSNSYVTLPITLNTLPHLVKVTQDSTASTSYDSSSHQLYFRNTTQKDVERVDLSGKSGSDSSSTPKPQKLTPENALSGVDEWLWAPGYDLGLMRQGSKWSLYSFNRFDLVHQSTTAWPDSVGSASWNPTNVNQLTHYFSSGGEQTLVQTDPLHKDTDRIFNFLNSAVSEPVVRWVGDGSDVMLKSKEGRLWRFTVYSKTLAAITQSETINDFLVSPDGKTVLAKQSDGSYFAIGIDGKNKQTIEGTMPLAQVSWSADSQSLWVVGSGESLSITKVKVSDNTKTQYSLADHETVGAITSVSLAEDQNKLVVAGSTGLGIIRLEKNGYDQLVVK